MQQGVNAKEEIYCLGLVYIRLQNKTNLCKKLSSLWLVVLICFLKYQWSISQKSTCLEVYQVC